MRGYLGVPTFIDTRLVPQEWLDTEDEKNEQAE